MSKNLQKSILAIDPILDSGVDYILIWSIPKLLDVLY